MKRVNYVAKISVPYLMERFKKKFRKHVRDASVRSYVPYSDQSRGALVILSNGDWVSGVRIENACYPLVICAVTSAIVSASSVGRRDVVGMMVSGKITEEEKSIVMQSVIAPLDQLDSDFLGQKHFTYDVEGKPLPTYRNFPLPLDPKIGIQLARESAIHAYVPESDFPVGAIAVTQDHKYFQGVNVECRDWTKILCAERAALAAAISAGAKPIKHLFVSCSKSPDATPCGACRQVIHEIAPESAIWIDRGVHKTQSFLIDDLLPHAFVL